LKTYGNDCITDMIKRKDSLTDEPEIVEETQSEYVKKLVQRVWDVYGHLQGLQMSNLTHAKDTPWDKTWNREKFSVIPDELIKEHFQSLKGK
jgi:uncharacterized phage-associated protein